MYNLLPFFRYIYLSFGISVSSRLFCYLITRAKFILFSISSGWLFWSVNDTSTDLNSELNVFKKIWFFGEISNKLPNGLFGTNICKTRESCWW